LISNPPEGSQVLLLPQNGQESASIGLADHPNIRPVRDTATGEVGLANYLTGSYVMFRENGDIEVFTEAGNLIANITGDVTLTVSGNMNAVVTGNIAATAAQINLNGVTIDSSGNIVTPGTVTADDFIET
jgi:phage gp45-like